MFCPSAPQCVKANMHIDIFYCVFSVEDVLTYFHLVNQQNMHFDQWYSVLWIQLYAKFLNSNLAKLIWRL